MTSGNGSRTPGTGSKEYDEIEALLRDHGVGLIGARDFGQLRLIGSFYGQVNQLLADINDILVPRDPIAVHQDNFAAVRNLIVRALAADRDRDSDHDLGAPAAGPAPLG